MQQAWAGDHTKQSSFDSNGSESEPGPSSTTPPSPSLPKGGGAIRGLGEKFAANPVTGTGSMTVPLAVSAGRADFGPQLSLAYDSGAGNGPFGFGWSLSLPCITRKTDKGLPQYIDGGKNQPDSDVFILSGAEDLVPVLTQDDHGNWVIQDIADLDENYLIRRYRPRVEGLFARIERWTRSDGDVHWRTISKDNILTVYGKDSDSRIFDPEGPQNRLRIFSWLICETRDDKGNAIVYQYKPEDGVNVDLARACERNRGGRDDRRRKANRYLKRVCYGNRIPLLGDAGKRPRLLTELDIQNANWMFEVVFDYGEHDSAAPEPGNAGSWAFRDDPFSSYRAGFEVRTTRLCQRVLMFHHIPDLPGGQQGYEGLVRSTDFTYSHEQEPANARNPVYTFLRAVTETGYKRQHDGYLQRSLPAVEFEYSQPIVQDAVEDVDSASLENLPGGLKDATSHWTDLHGEGIPGILTEHTGAWFYKRNLSQIDAQPGHDAPQAKARFAPAELVATKPNLDLFGGQAHFMDLAGDGQLDLVVFDGPLPGLCEHDEHESWRPFRPFRSRLNREIGSPNVRLVDLDGDGHADVLITEEDAFIWHESLAEEGFGPARRVAQALDEEKGPRLVFADGTQSIYLADMSGDGLTDLVRIRNGEVCYWPNLGYAQFGAKITMDFASHSEHAPVFDHSDRFDHKRIRLADIDGSGTTDIIYLHSDGVRLYFNQSGNGWSAPQVLRAFPRIDDLVDVTTTDLLGDGTACLVWSSPLPGDARRQMRYVKLMGGHHAEQDGQGPDGSRALAPAHKPHLLVAVKNNLGAETRIQYSPSTKFYLQDKRDGKPWITRLPFPVHVVERVETYDRISGNRFVSRYAYHHGYFDDQEREFRGFGMVDQWDTEEIGSVPHDQRTSTATNLNRASYVPPIYTKTWYHTGAYLGRNRISNYFAGLQDGEDAGEYYREPGWTDAEAQQCLLPDTILPTGLTLDEERQACRALKGTMLRQEVYANDAPLGSSPTIRRRAQTPYLVVEQNFTIRTLQPRGENRHAVFFAHPCEAITYHYERRLLPIRNGQIVDEVAAAGNPDTQWLPDPRIQHALTLEVDRYGNVLQEVAIAYGRRFDESDPALLAPDRAKQRLIHISHTENRFTNALDDIGQLPDDYRIPLVSETRSYELRKAQQEKRISGQPAFFRLRELRSHITQADDGIHDIAYEDWRFTKALQAVADHPDRAENYFRRLIGHVRTLYRRDDLSGLLPLGQLEPSALPGESYELALTPGLLAQVFQRAGDVLLPAPAAVLEGQGDDQGGYVAMDGNWWRPSGCVFYSRLVSDTAQAELQFARQHFFLPHRYRNPFGHTTFLTYDNDDAAPQNSRNLLVVKNEDAVGNIVSALHDYRVLQPWQMTDANGNRSQVQFDALGMVVGTAVMGKAPPAPSEGDSFATFTADLTAQQIKDYFLAPDPRALAISHLGTATTRIIYDFDRVPASAATIARETHVSELAAGQQLKVQLSFSYCDGFGREMQKKIQAEPGPVPVRNAAGRIVIGASGQPEMTPQDVNPRWVGSGWVIFNNKGKPVRQFEPFFSDTHRLDSDVRIGVSPWLFYDPIERMVATVHPNHTWEKVVFDPWQQLTFDVNDTLLDASGLTDPGSDEDVKGFFSRLPDSQYLPTWYEQRRNLPADDAERIAADNAATHRQTPTVSYLDTLQRPFITVVHNRFMRNGDLKEERYAGRVELDIEGNPRAVIDAKERVVMRYDYDLLGTVIHQSSMEAGERWTLKDVSANPIRGWDSRSTHRRSTYDKLRRGTGLYVTEDGVERLAERTTYGEAQGNATNHRARVYQVSDGAGIVTSVAYDFKGNLLQGRRDLLPDYAQAVNWLLNPATNDGSFISRSTFDALNRPLSVTMPDGSIYCPVFNEANLLDKVDVKLRGAAAITSFVTNINYDAKGQRKLIAYGNGAQTTYDYDPLTLRLIHLTSTRPAGLNGLASIYVSPTVVQDLHYTYDPAGNISRVEDAALKTVFHDNQQIQPVGQYVYDAIYRLIEATGREHIGQTGHNVGPQKRRDYDFVGLAHMIAHPNDLEGLRTYSERYEYDAAGNIEVVRHSAAGGSWTRRYEYEEESLIEAGAQSNRLTRTKIGNAGNHVEAYSYRDTQNNDLQGCMTAIAGMRMAWDFEDQLQRAERDGGVTAYYVYDAAGQRVRKVIHGQNGVRKEERIYVGGYELYREYGGDGQTIALQRETVHVMDDKQRIALIETKITPALEQPLIRYQLGNHLGSASVELDQNGGLISYEDYHSYGTTAFQATSAAEVNPKRYRYTGKERDDESGLYYHGARYYAPWLARWINADPGMLTDGMNLYAYVSGNPVRLIDDTGLNGKEAEKQLFFSERQAFDAAATATKRGRGFSTALREYAREIVDLWGGPKRWDITHRKPFVETAAGETGSVGIEERTANRSRGRMEADQAKATGKGVRTKNVDVAAPEGVRQVQPEPPKIQAVKPKPLVVAPATAVQKAEQTSVTAAETLMAGMKKSGSAASKVLKGAGAAKKVLGPIGIGVGVYFLKEKMAHAANTTQPVATDTATKMEQAFDQVATAADIGADAAALLPGTPGTIASVAILQKEIAIKGIQVTGGDKRIVDAGTSVEKLAKRAGASDVTAETSGAVTSGVTAMGEGVGVIGMVAMGPMGWAALGVKAAFKK